MSWDDEYSNKVVVSSDPLSSENRLSSTDGSSCAENDRRPTYITDRKEEHPPRDKYWFVYMIVMINGIGVLLPWNMFITIAPQYYVEYWFTWNGVESHYGKSFMSALGIISLIPNLLMALVSVMALIKGPILWRIAGALSLNCVLIGVVLTLVVAQQPSESDQNWFYILSLTIAMLLNASNGLYQNSMFGVAADFPFAYTNAMVVGSNICGTFTSLISIFTTEVFKNEESVAILYFSISLGTLLFCGFTLWIVTKLEFYRFYAEKGERARAADNCTRPSLKQFLDTFIVCWPQFLNVFLAYFATMSVFPSVLVGIDPIKEPSDALDPIYYALVTFLNFNLFAALGSGTASYIQIPPPRLLFIPVIARLVFIPFFMLCRYDMADRVMPTVFNNAWWFIIGTTVMAYTAGYFSSLGMMYAPGVAPPHLQKIAGQCAALSLVAGAMAGVGFTPAITAMVENIS